MLELPNLKINLHKQIIFILNDYLDNYLVLDLNTALNEFKRPTVNKVRLKQAKIRQIVYRRLLEDFSPQSKYKRTGKI